MSRKESLESCALPQQNPLLISVLPPVIMKFRQRCPEVEIITYTGVIGELFDMVRQNDVDLLFFLDKKTYHSEWVKVTERLEPIVFAVSAEHPLAAQKNISLERVLEESIFTDRKGHQLSVRSGTESSGQKHGNSSLFGNGKHGRYYKPATSQRRDLIPPQIRD